MRLRHIHSISIVLFAAALLFTDGTAAQVRDRTEPQGFLDIPWGDGTSSSESNKDKWIDLLSFSRPFPSEGAARPSKVTFTKRVDGASPKLLEAFKKGTRFPTIRVDVREARNNRAVYLKYELKNARITSYQVDARLEHITLTCEKIEGPRDEAVAAPRR